MPISYNPSVAPDSSGFALGLARLGMAVTSAVDQRNEEQKQRGRLAQTLRSYATQAGILPKEQADQLGLEDLQGTVQGYHVKQAMEERAAKMRELDQAIKLYQARAIGTEQQNKFSAALPEFLKTYADRMQPDDAGDSQTPGAALAAAMSMHPDVAGSPQFDNLLNSLQKSRDMASPDTSPMMTVLRTPTGQEVPVVHTPGGHGFQIVPSADLGGETPTRDVNGATQAWDGRRWVTVNPPKEAPGPKLPESFHKTMDELGADIFDNRQALSDPNFDPERKDKTYKGRAAKERNLNSALARGKATIDRYVASGYLDENQRAQLYGELGLPTSSPTAPPAASAPAKTSAAAPPPAEDDGKVMVEKDGKQYRLPKAQLKQAQAEGYRLVQ